MLVINAITTKEQAYSREQWGLSRYFFPHTAGGEEKAEAWVHPTAAPETLVPEENAVYL